MKGQKNLSSMFISLPTKHMEQKQKELRIKLTKAAIIAIAIMIMLVWLNSLLPTPEPEFKQELEKLRLEQVQYDVIEAHAKEEWKEAKQRLDEAEQTAKDARGVLTTLENRIESLVANKDDFMPLREE